MSRTDLIHVLSPLTQSSKHLQFIFCFISQVMYPPPCESNPCMNGGLCLNGHVTQRYVCVCLEGFIGTNCEGKSQTYARLILHHIITLPDQSTG